MRTTCLTIVCPGHSGSTLLGMCLNSHTDIHTFGEFGSLKSRFDRIKSGNKRGLCSFCYEDCEYIDATEARRIRRHYYSPYRKTAYAKSIVGHPRYVTHLASRTGSRIVCDTSKSVSWAEFVNRWTSWGIDLRYLFLLRDPRAVIASHIRKSRDLGASIDKYKDEANRMLKFRESLGKQGSQSRFMDIRYEEFAAHPEKGLSAVCGFLGLEFQSTMIDYDEHEHHIVGGNDKARSRIKKKNSQYINYQKSDIHWYLNQKSKFFVDERWRTELDEAQQERILKALSVEMDRLGYAA